ncbi:glycoside hydrolase family 26 protein [Anaerophilus nitritogenes]|uniref:glycoside hydrolase family 26 protein n=1 Tax=Anaerophilus nitritogenes TaxID=2498136 RepID=UPI001930FBEC|nr:glycosyl hydrolase [Anaerophilus nitritogenes]
MKKIGIGICIGIMCFSSFFSYGNEQVLPHHHQIQKGSASYIETINQEKNRYVNYGDGYMIDYPSHMEVDTSLEAVRTLIKDQEREIEIYYDNFHNTPNSAPAYKNYSNAFIKNTKDHIKEYENTATINGMKVHLLKWSRKKLSKVSNDKNFYVSAEIVKNDKEVYTIFIKSSRQFYNFEDYMDVISSFKIIEKKGNPSINTKFKPVERKLNEETKEFYYKYFVNSDKLRWGIFEQSAPASFSYLKGIENRLDYEFKFLVRYQSLDVPMPLEELKNAYNNNRYVELTLQTMHMNEENESITYDILDGKYDDYFEEYAKKIKEFNHPILFRLNNEMNGDWCVYSSYYSSKDTNLYKEVWKYIYHVFEKNGVDNVLWVWNPHDLSFPNFKWNHYLTYYPGDEYVDIIGLTGYNTGNYYPGEIWRSFEEVYPHVYNEYMDIFEQPFMITEFGSNEIGGDKVKWIHEMFDYMYMHPFKNIKVAIWWNGIDWDPLRNPARIYRLDNREDVMDTFRQRLKDYK